MESAFWGLLGTMVGAVASIGTTWISGRNAARSQRESTRLEQIQQARTFQRETLLALQDAFHDALRMAVRVHLEDMAAFKTTGKWGRPSLSEEVDEGFRLTIRKLMILTERVSDNALRMELGNIRKQLGQGTLTQTQPEAQAIQAQMNAAAVSAMEHLGSVLRGLY